MTIVIPTVSRPHLVWRAVESALAQTAQDIEILVSDNGSTDETQDVLAKYRDPRLRMLRRETTISASAHGNYLLEQAQGEFILPLSDDDFLEPDMAARVLDLFNRRPDLSFVFTGCWMHYGPEPFPALTGPEVESGEDFIAAYFAEKRELCWCACVTRVADLRAIGPIPDDLIFGDYFYWMKLVFKGDVGCIAAPLSHYTFMTDNLSSSTPALIWASQIRVLADEVIDTYERCSKNPSKTEELRRICAKWVARATANQFVWNATRGANTKVLMRAFADCLPFFARERTAWPRIAIALTLPQPLLKWLIHRAAARRRTKLLQDPRYSATELASDESSLRYRNSMRNAHLKE
jgi:glycosyltransferase involved in cell wall biosynthesis